MASRRTPPTQRGSFHPPSDNEAYRDLLFFEERLKKNAALLRRRKSRYQLFLSQLFVVIVFLLCEVFLEPQLLALPLNIAYQKAFPEDYDSDHKIELQPYVAKGMLFVALTTLMLFFASGMYEEKIAYANRYVPHANRALRNFNIHLNVRHQPLRSLLVNPISYIRHRNGGMAAASRPGSPEHRRKRGASVPIPPIPPASNPRGELIFSSRVDRSFQEGYERYRAAFERRREAHERYVFARTWWGWRALPWNWTRRTPQPASYIREYSPSRSIASTPRGRGSETDASSSSTPSSSRRSSPVPRSSPGRSKGGTGSSRRGAPPASVHRRLTPDKGEYERKESLSSLFSE